MSKESLNSTFFIINFLHLNSIIIIFFLMECHRKDRWSEEKISERVDFQPSRYYTYLLLHYFSVFRALCNKRMMNFYNELDNCQTQNLNTVKVDSSELLLYYLSQMIFDKFQRFQKILYSMFVYGYQVWSGAFSPPYKQRPQIRLELLKISRKSRSNNLSTQRETNNMLSVFHMQFSLISSARQNSNVF